MDERLTTADKLKEDNFDTDIIEVLQGLGYKLPDIKKILPSIHSELSIEEQIKEALKLMLK